MKKFYLISVTKGKFAIPQTKVPLSKGFEYAKALAESFMKKENADGYQISHPCGALTELDI